MVIKSLWGAAEARTSPSWAHTCAADDYTSAIYPNLGRSVWRFMLGLPPEESRVGGTGGLVQEVLHGDDERARAEAAYALAGCGRRGAEALLGVLDTGSEAAQRAAGHGLGAVGPAAARPILRWWDAQPPGEETRSRAHARLWVTHAMGEAVAGGADGDTALRLAQVLTAQLAVCGAAIVSEVAACGGEWPRGGGGHPTSTGFPNASPNPKERQAWAPKLLHATIIQSLGLVGASTCGRRDAGPHTAWALAFAACCDTLRKPEPGGGNPDYGDSVTLGSVRALPPPRVSTAP